jgi:DNA-binding LacI/PurR family transcriptional regulator
MIVTMNDIAKKLRVSRATVSYVLSGRSDGLVSEATKKIVHSAAKEMGYRPNRMAAALIKGRTQMIALLVHDFHPAYYSYMIHHVCKQVEGTDYHLNVAQVGAKTSPMEATYWPVDGVMAFDCAPFIDQLPDNLLASVPVVSFGGSYSTKVDHVGVDIYEATLSVVRHMVDIGRRRIAYLVPKSDCCSGSARHDAYCTCLREARLDPMFVQVDEPRTVLQREAARNVVRALFRGRQNPEIDALFCFSDEMALGAHLALRQAGVSIPSDVALAGIDGICDGEYADPPITATRQPFERMAETAWQFLSRRLEDKTLPRQELVLVPPLIVRGSTVTQTLR